MIIVSGWIRVVPSARAAYLADALDVMAQAREADGCLDFHLSPDALESDRINVFEQWDSVEAVEAFRGSGPSADQSRDITDARVFQYEVDAGKTH
jgi:quinol monooxygenase YgiN